MNISSFMITTDFQSSRARHLTFAVEKLPINNCEGGDQRYGENQDRGKDSEAEGATAYLKVIEPPIKASPKIKDERGNVREYRQ
jgi:hypothetical protein